MNFLQLTVSVLWASTKSRDDQRETEPISLRNALSLRSGINKTLLNIYILFTMFYILYFTLYYIILYYIILYYITLHYIIIISCHIILYYITLHYITLY